MLTSCWKELHFEISRQNRFYVVMTHHTTKANLEKSSSWPPEAIPYCHSFCVTFYYPKTPNLYLGSDLEGLWGQQLRHHSIIKKGLALLLGTILCKFGQIFATGNAFVGLVLGRNCILKFSAKIASLW